MSQSKLPDWAVKGAEIISDYGGVQIICRVSATSAWSTKSGEDDTTATRWVNGYHDCLKRHGSSCGWTSSLAYPTSQQPGRRLKRTRLLSQQEWKIKKLAEKVGVRVNGKEDLAELTMAVELLRDETQKYLVLIQKYGAEDRLEEEERAKS